MYLNKIIQDRVNQVMTFQFKPRVKQTGRIQELEQEIVMLKNYTLALQKENASKDQERKALHDEILRLSHQEKVITSNISSVSALNFQESSQVVAIKQEYSQLKNNYDSLLLEHNNLNFKLKNIEYSNSLLIAYERDITKQSQLLKSNELKMTQLERKIASYESQITHLKSIQNVPPPIITQYQATISRVDQLQSQISCKNEEIINLSREAMAHEDQITSLKNQINNYLQKIKTLTLQLEKVEKSSVKQTIRYIQHQQTPILRGKLEQLNAINGSLAAQINSLRNQNLRQVEILKDKQRRINILQQSNINLEKELRFAIEAKKAASRIIQQPRDDSELKEAIHALKKELQEVKKFNILVKQENYDLFSQLQKYKEHSYHNHGKSNHKNVSKSPLRTIKDDKIPRSQIIQARNTFNGSFNQKSPINRQNIQIKIKDTLKSGYSENIPSALSTNQRYNDLQRKIHMLQNENQVLKQQLVYQV